MSISDAEVIAADESEPRLAFGSRHNLIARKIATINGHPAVWTVDLRLADLFEAELAKAVAVA